MKPCPANHTPRRNGWTAERQAIFIAALGAHRSVTAAADAAGMTRESAYWLRRQPGGAGFRARWDAALAVAYGAADHEVWDADPPERWSTRRLVRRLKRIGDGGRL
jgi:hypothetical protein